ncbi:hypothetical protein RchiOBHm_Chr7g0206201 [Rosa chinensis]|uniref:Uncharacterized protein n=1 Tax=Rosa chinensis TaxID=74649 RepID=A0A2P6P939_ROSCH|nr:hypothetical protein RchiOBHm_Chr7g0206201 [Rosa chinensis]
MCLLPLLCVKMCQQQLLFMLMLVMYEQELTRHQELICHHKPTCHYQLTWLHQFINCLPNKKSLLWALA